MSLQGKSPDESIFPERKPEELNAESTINSSSPEVEGQKSSNHQLSEKLAPPNIQSKVSRTLPNVPNSEPTRKRILPRIPVNEARKVRQRPRRVLPYLPPIVQEILRWSVHPQEVLRGAASVSHLLNLPAIREESMPSVQPIEATVPTRVPRKKRILPSIPPTENRALPSKQPTAARKPLPPFRAEFRKRMLPSLPTIEEQTSPIIPEVKFPDGSQESAENEALQDPELQPAEKQVQTMASEEELRKNKNKKKRKRKKVKENQSSLQTVEKEGVVELKLENREKLKRTKASVAQSLSNCHSETGRSLENPKVEEKPLPVQRKVKRTQKICQSEAKDKSPNSDSTAEHNLPRLATKEGIQDGRHLRENEGLPSVHPKVNRSRPSLLSADSYVWPNPERKVPEEMPRLRPKLARRSKTMLQPPEKERNSHPLSMKPVLPSIRTKEKPVMPKPPSSPRPTVTRVRPTANQPLPSIPPAQEPIIQKPPSSPKPTVTRVRPKVSRPLPSIPAAQERMIPNPPSTPKGPQSARPIVTRARPIKSRPLPSIQSVEEQTLPSLSSSSQERLVKFPLPSVHRKEKNYCSASGTVQPTMESNLKPLVEETERSAQRKMSSDKQQ